uniref:Uncharacterized protein n=1 Tax=Arundo donax TaxID=35708 RepID=A0A0A9HQB5_ARUDO
MHVHHHIKCLVSRTLPMNIIHQLFLRQSLQYIVLPKELGPLLWMPVMMIVLFFQLNLRERKKQKPSGWLVSMLN